MNLRWKLFVPLILLALAALAYGTFVWTPRYLAAEFEQSIGDAKSHLTTLGEALVDPLLQGDVSQVYAVLDGVLKKKPEWVSLRLQDARGRLVYPLDPPAEIADSHTVRRISSAIGYLDRPLGEIWLTLDRSADLAAAELRVYELLTVIYLGIAFGLGIVGVVLEFLVLRPIGRLSAASRRLAQGDYAAPLPLARRDELGAMVADFTAMRTAIGQHEQELMDENVRRRLAEERVVHELTAQQVIGEILKDSLAAIPLEQFLENSLNRILSIPWLPVSPKGAIFLADADRRELRMAAERGLSEALKTACRWLPAGHCLCGRVAESHEQLFATCVDEQSGHRLAAGASHGLLCVPILSGECLLGVLNLYVAPGHEHNAEESDFLGDVTSALASAIVRREAETRLTNSEGRIRNLIETSSDCVWEITAAGVYTYVSPRIRDVLGFEPSEIIGRTPFDLMPPEEAGRQRALFEKHVSESSPIVGLENVNVHKNGLHVLLEASGQPFFDEQGKLIGYRGVNRDITQRRLTEGLTQRLGRIVDQAFNEIYIFDAASLRFLQANQGALRNLGYSLDELRQRTPVDIAPDYTRAQFEALLAPLRERRVEQLLFETVHRRKFGSTYPVEVRLQLSSNETPPVFMATIQDISVRQQAEQALREANEELERRVQERSGELLQQKYALDQHSIVAITDRTGKIQYVNDRFCNVSQYSRAELIGQNHKMLNSGLHSRSFFDELWSTIRSGQVWHGEIRNRRKDGSYYWMDTTIVPFVDGEGRPFQYVAIRTDITERKQAMEKLRHSEERFSKAFHASPDMITLSRLRDNAFIDVNESFLRSTGYTREDVLGRSPADLNIWEDMGRARAVKKQLQEAGRVRDLEAMGRSRSGQPFPVSYSADLLDIDGETCILAVIHDLRRIKQVESELEHARDVALEASRAKSEFLATMSHEIRTPLNGVLGMAQLLQETPLTSEQRDYVATILGSGESLLGIINEILDYSRFEAGRVSLDAVEFDLRAGVDSVMDMLATLAQNKKLELSSHVDDPVPARLHGDPLRLRQILVNLVGNAIKFTERGRVSVRVQREPDTNEGEIRLRFTVTDTGIGVPADARERIFEAFTQADGTMTRRYGGTGLGLAIARQLVGLMGGELGVLSEPGQGSIFWFTAGFRAVAMTKTEAPSPSPEVAHTALSGHVLVVEDNMANQLVAQRMLEKLGCDVDVVDGGALALERLAAVRYDLVFMDCQMPGMDGFETTRAIRRHEAGQSAERRLPVVAMTANVFSQDREACLAAGMDDFLAKPVSIASLRSILKKWLTVQADAVPTRPPVPATDVSAEVMPALDAELFTELYELMGEGFGNFVSIFMEDTARHLTALRAAVVSRDVVLLKQLAHLLKGSAANACAMTLSAQCGGLESLARNASDEQLSAHIAGIEAEYRRVAAAFASVVNR